MTDVVGLQTAVSEVPDLDDLVPSSGDDHGAAVGEKNGRHPVGVAIILRKVSMNNSKRDSEGKGSKKRKKNLQ